MAGSVSATTRPKERCGASHWEGATGPSPAPNAAPTAPPSCSPSSPPHASTTSTQKPGSPTSSLASPIFPPRVCTNCCPGNGSACAKPTCPPISRPPEPLAPHHKPASARAPATIPRPCPCEYAQFTSLREAFRRLHSVHKSRAREATTNEPWSPLRLSQDEV